MGEKVCKTLSRNDTGETNSHQSGMSIPKSVMKTGVFPILGTTKLNPRTTIVFYEDDGTRWEFQFIYYNDFFFGKPRHKAHDEYRLTCIVDLIRKHGIKAGDEIWFSIDEDGKRTVGFFKQYHEHAANNHTQIKADCVNDDSLEYGKPTVLKLSGKWRSVKL